MISRRALLGLGTGFVGITVAVVGVAIDQAWLAVPAGCCALLAGLSSLDLADRLGRATASHDVLVARASMLEDQSDQMAARTLHLEAEVLDTRSQLAEAIRHETARQTTRTDSAWRSGSGPDPVIDQVTGLFNERFFMATLEKRVSAARRGLRPLGLTLLEVVADISSGRPVPSDPTIVTEALVGTLREADTVAHLDDGRFAVLLEDTPENGAIWTIERVRRRLSQSHPGHTVWAGLSCYPAHGFDQDQLVGQASAALKAAKEWRQDRIEVAVTPDD